MRRFGIALAMVVMLVMMAITSVPAMAATGHESMGHENMGHENGDERNFNRDDFFRFDDFFVSNELRCDRFFFDRDDCKGFDSI